MKFAAKCQMNNKNQPVSYSAVESVFLAVDKSSQATEGKICWGKKKVYCNREKNNSYFKTDATTLMTVYRLLNFSSFCVSIFRCDP